MSCDPQSLLDAVRCFNCIPAGMLASVGTKLLCELANAPKEPPLECIHPIEVDWYNRIVSGLGIGAAPTLAQRQAVCEFCQALDAAGITDKFFMINIMLPGNLDRMMYPLLPSAPAPESAPWINHNFVPADLTVNGLQGDGLTKYLDTGMNAFTATIATGGAFNSGLTAVRSQIASSPAADQFSIGCEFLDIMDTGIWYSFALSCLSGLAPVGLPGSTGVLGFDPDRGTAVHNVTNHEVQFASMSRLAEDDLKLYWAYTALPGFAQIDSNINLPPDSVLPNVTLYGLGIHYTDSTPDDHPANLSDARNSFLAFHQGLTAVETEALYHAVQDLRADLGGGTV